MSTFAFQMGFRLGDSSEVGGTPGDLPQISTYIDAIATGSLAKMREALWLIAYVSVRSGAVNA